MDAPALLKLAHNVRGADTGRLDLAPEASGLLNTEQPRDLATHEYLTRLDRFIAKRKLRMQETV